MKQIRILTIALASLLLSSCGGASPASSTSQESSSSTIIESSSSTSQESSSSLPQSLWGEELGEYMRKSFGAELPYFSSDTLESEKGSDQYGDPTLWLYLHYADDSSEYITGKLSEYATCCDTLGYKVSFQTNRYFDEATLSYLTYDVYYADLVIAPDKAIEMQFLEGAHNGECLGIYAYGYTPVSETSWPTSLLNNVLGFDVPHYEEEGCTYVSWEQNDGTDNSYGNYVGIAVKGVDKTSEDTYSAILEKASYKVDYVSDSSMYQAVDETKSHSIAFYYDAESFNCLYIYVVKGML